MKARVADGFDGSVYRPVMLAVGLAQRSLCDDQIATEAGSGSGSLSTDHSGVHYNCVRSEWGERTQFARATGHADAA